MELANLCSRSCISTSTRPRYSFRSRTSGGTKTSTGNSPTKTMIRASSNGTSRCTNSSTRESGVCLGSSESLTAHAHRLRTDAFGSADKTGHLHTVTAVGVGALLLRHRVSARRTFLRRVLLHRDEGNRSVTELGGLVLPTDETVIEVRDLTRILSDLRADRLFVVELILASHKSPHGVM